MTDARWEAFVTSHRDGLVYHHPRWLQVIQEAYGHEPVCLACEGADGVLLGVLPLFRTRGLLTGPCLSSLPHTPVAGPLARSDRSLSALVLASMDRIRAERRTRLLLKAPGDGLAGQVDGLVALPREETYILELPQRPEELRFGNARNNARIKWAVSKAARSGLHVRPAETPAELRDWYRLYLETMRYHAVPPRPYRFFWRAWELLRPRGLMRLLLAEQRGAGRARILAGSIFLMFGQTVFYAFSGRRRGESDQRSNDLIQWHAIHDACREGFRRYDMGEVGGSQRGLAGFKSKWGAEPRRLYRCYYPGPKGPGASPTDRVIWSRRVLTTVWRRLPLGATALAGDWIYRYLVG